MRVGIATDHDGFALKAELMFKLRGEGLEVIEFGAHELTPGDDYPDSVIPLACDVVAGTVDRGVAICGSGAGASVWANKVSGVRASLIYDHFSAKHGVEDDHMKIVRMGGRTVGRKVAWDLLQTFWTAEFSQAERHLRRLNRMISLEALEISDVRRATATRQQT
jgi:ribose 5-phosphate isomerase B